MKPRSGENPPFNSNSRSHNCRGVKSQETKLRESSCRSAARWDRTIRLFNSPQCGGVSVNCKVRVSFVFLKVKRVWPLRSGRPVPTVKLHWRVERCYRDVAEPNCPRRSCRGNALHDPERSRRKLNP